uniref:F-box protein At2g27310-like n=1 Tax=Erigeron canadensis TaxID=72917 RepID=UPI001CB93395|nr:F-box protein At2g27310-like [Erigeron canadensis]
MAIASIHEDIIRTHILTKLDGQTLAAASCVSSSLQNLCSDQNLWSQICSSNCPSTDHQLVKNAVSNFTAGHRSFFSDTFPSPTNHLTSTVTSSFPPTPQIISSVDIKYDNKIIFSKVEVTNTIPTNWFETSPFRIDLLEPKEVVPSSVKVLGDDDQVLLLNLEKNVTLSWVIIDTIQNRGVNLSSKKPVFVHRNWLTDEIELTFGLVISHDDTYVNCNIEVNCGVNVENGELYVSGVSLTVLDVDGKCLNGKGSMVIVQGLMAAMRQGNDGGERWKERYEEYVQIRRERKKDMEMRERRLDLVCVASGVIFLLAFWSFALY